MVQAEKVEPEKSKTDPAKRARLEEHRRICELMYPRALAAVQKTMGSDLRFAPRLITIDSFKSGLHQFAGGMQFATNVIITLDDLEATQMPSYYLLAHKLTHEITHSWLKYNNYNFPTEVTEGICELSAAISTKMMFNGGTRVKIDEAIADTVSFANFMGGLPAEIMLKILPPESGLRDQLSDNAAKYILSSYSIASEMAKWRDSRPEKQNASPTEFVKHLLANWKSMDEISKLSSRNSTEWVSKNIHLQNRNMETLFRSSANRIKSPISSTLPGYTQMMLRGKLNARPDPVTEQAWQTQYREAQEKKEVDALEAQTAKMRHFRTRIKLMHTLIPAWMGLLSYNTIRHLVEHHDSLVSDAMYLLAAAIPISIGIYVIKKLGESKLKLQVLLSSNEEILSIVKNPPNQSLPTNGQNKAEP